uniref:Bee-milk protein n=1 Tax=Heterorhabditis bacteriophora TaxID=37862 RepID=A0A1I7XMJ4_HETBA
MPPGCVAVVGITSRQNVLSVINSCGYVYSWIEGGVEWKREDLLQGQIYCKVFFVYLIFLFYCKDLSFAVPICSLSYSRVSSWAVTCEGDILVRIGTEDKWSIVVPPEMNGSKFTKVAVSPNGFFIWVISGGRAWARRSNNLSFYNSNNLVFIFLTVVRFILMFPTFHSSDLCCVAAGDNVIWALDNEGILLKLRGLAAGNPAGNYWMKISQSFGNIACDLDSGLWAIDVDNRLMRHNADLYIPEPLPSLNSQMSYEFV